MPRPNLNHRKRIKNDGRSVHSVSFRVACVSDLAGDAVTHEPECDYAGVMTIGMPCRQCAAIRAAYQRGREDAAKAVNALSASWKVDENGWQTLGDCMECGGTYEAYNSAIDDAYAAVRGDQT